MDFRLLRALNAPNYRMFFIGQGLSLIGTWLSFVARSWLVFRLSQSALLLGVAGFLGQIPSFYLAPFAGVLIERWDRRKVLLVTQALVMTYALILAFLTLTGHIQIWHVLVISALQGITGAFDMPARQAFVIELIDRREDLGNAIALNSLLINGSRLIGPSIAGILIAFYGEGICFLLDGTSYLAIITALLLIRPVPLAKPEGEIRLLADFKEGLAYATQGKAISSILLLIALVSLVGMPYTVLMPVFANRILNGDSHALGFLMSAIGVGAVFGGTYLASLDNHNRFERMIPWATALFGSSLIAFALSKRLELSLLVLLFTGFGMVVQNSLANTILQTVADEDKRGRLMSLYTMAFNGMTPFGSLLAGWIATIVGAPLTVGVGGALCLLGGLWFSRQIPAIQAEIGPVETSRSMG